jgi:hypothetical protein
MEASPSARQPYLRAYLMLLRKAIFELDYLLARSCFA